MEELERLKEINGRGNMIVEVDDEEDEEDDKRKKKEDDRDTEYLKRM